jgi:DNA repair protein RadD
MLELRDYQEEALLSLFEYWAENKGRAPIVCAPTGSGKSLMIAEFCKRVCKESPHVRIMILAHVRELLTQNEKELKSIWKDANTGIYSAGLGKKQVTRQITFAGIQSVYSKVFKFPKIDIVIVDECHLVPRTATTRYCKFFADIMKANPNTCICGFSATPYRLDSGLLHQGDGAWFDGIAYSVDIKQLISDGYLVPVVSKGGVAKINLTSVHTRAGDYAANELAHAADSPELVRLAVEEIVAYGKDRKAWLLFCSGLVHAEHVATEIGKHGIECKIVTGDTPKEERDLIISDFKNGKLRAIANVGVMTTGVNVPRCDLIALLTATQSTGKYIQMVGRSMRPFPFKENALLLDYGGNCERHGMIDDIEPVRTRNIFNVVENAEPVKECPSCHAILHTRVMICPACNYEYPVTASHGTEAYGGAVLSEQQESFVVAVKETYISRHKKMGGLDSVKVAFYDADDKEYAMWLALDHTGYAHDKAAAIVKQFGGQAQTVSDALKEQDYWKKVTHIRVRPEGKFFRIDGFTFSPHHSVQKLLPATTQEVLVV